VSRAVGYRWAAVSGLLDVAKAAVAVLFVVAIGGDQVAQVAAALAAIVVTVARRTSAFMAAAAWRRPRAAR